MPGKVASAAKPVVGLSQADRIEVLARGAGIWVVGAGCTRKVLGTRLEFIVVIPARAAGNGEHLRNDVKVDGGEHRVLFVAALQILAERCRVATLARVGGGGKRVRFNVTRARG